MTKTKTESPDTPYLVILPSQTGPVPQIWYDHSGRFVGCGEMVPISKHKLPLPAFPDKPWSIDHAVAWVTANGR